MKAKLPRFEGETPQMAMVKLSGRADDRIGALARNEECFWVIKGVVANVDHGDHGGVLARIHKVKAVAMFYLEAAQGERILTEAALLADERFGIRDLFHQDPPEEGQL